MPCLKPCFAAVSGFKSSLFRGSASCFAAVLLFPACTPFQAAIPEDSAAANNFIGWDTYDESSGFNNSRRRGRGSFSQSGAYPPGRYQAGGPASCDLSFFNQNSPAVRQWIHKLTARSSGRASMQRYLERSARYLPLMETILEKQGLTGELAYVAMAESGYSSHARSSQNAVGYWQFIASTGRRYGLRIDKYVDERRDFYLSTQAAGKYLSELCLMFGTWPLALAAYNAGEGRIGALIKKYGGGFWHLAQRGKLPRETANYVPKIIAMRRISARPWRYGFLQVRYQQPLSYQIVEFQKPLSLRSLSQAAGVSYQEIRRLNPKYKTDTVPVYGSGVSLRIPSRAF